jgi:hypothetical protein
MDLAALVGNSFPMANLRIIILRELRQFYGEWPNSWLGAHDITAFRRDPAGFAAVAAELVADGLILRTGGDHAAQVGFRLNPERTADLRRELSPPVWRVLLLLALSLLVGAIAAFITFRGL